MFALEISFQDGVSQPEIILVRRPQAIVGGAEYAHVQIDDLKDQPFQLRIARDLGRRFSTSAMAVQEGHTPPRTLEGSYEGSASIELGRVRLNVSSLDTDLVVRDGEPPDKAGVRTLRQACLSTSPRFPAIVVAGAQPIVVSFNPEEPVLIGRAKQCAVRLDSSDISARHARMGFENGEFWIEDLGSTNGTFLAEQQISGKVSLPAGVPVVLGRDISLFGVTSEDQINRAAEFTPESLPKPAALQQRYPVLVSTSEVARPARLVLPLGAQISVGRDPTSDIWLGAPHVSRRHCIIRADADEHISVIDQSTNGTAYNGGILRKGESLSATPQQPRVLDFGNGVTLAVCFTEGQEQQFVTSQGSASAFAGRGGHNDHVVNLAPMTRSKHDARMDAYDDFTDHGGLLYRLHVAYRSAGVVGKIFVLFAVLAFLMICMVVAQLLSPIIARLT
ncbi:MAG: FHA domain-containing protein [Bdellovibrionota bacterium]|nr:MAG: FHA domain-containing protein [Bdellovibrionota bacterium]